MFNKYPYTNFHELNLEYFIKHFEEIFDQWQELYTELQNWKVSTTEELESWKTEVENGIADEQRRVLAELEAWKTETGEDIDDWEASVLTALNSWKDDFETLFATTFANLTQIKTDAETARDAAQAAQEAAEDAQEAAEDAADSVNASVAQIAQNADNISELKTKLYEIREPSENLAYFTELEYRKFGANVYTYWIDKDTIKIYGTLNTSWARWNLLNGNDEYTNSYPTFTPNFNAGTYTLDADDDLDVYYGTDWEN